MIQVNPLAVTVAPAFKFGRKRNCEALPRIAETQADDFATDTGTESVRLAAAF